MIQDSLVTHRVAIPHQPTDTSCGPTCLKGILDFYDHDVPIETLIASIPKSHSGGTLGVHLAQDALNRGFKTSIFTHNLKVFDPSWFALSDAEMIEKLRLQGQSQKGLRTKGASMAYAEFLSCGGDIKFEDLTPDLLSDLLVDVGPLICGLSSTYLYRSVRERNTDCEEDDVHGFPQGHFVVLAGISTDRKFIKVHDPYESEYFQGREYWVPTLRLIASILIGVITYDANLICIHPGKEVNQ